MEEDDAPSYKRRNKRDSQEEKEERAGPQLQSSAAEETLFVNSARVICVEGETPRDDQVDSANVDDELVEGLLKLSLGEHRSRSTVASRDDSRRSNTDQMGLDFR